MRGGGAGREKMRCRGRWAMMKRRDDDEMDGGRIERGFLWERMLGAGGALLKELVLKPLLGNVRLACEVAACER